MSETKTKNTQTTSKKKVEQKKDIGSLTNEEFSQIMESAEAWSKYSVPYRIAVIRTILTVEKGAFNPHKKFKYFAPDEINKHLSEALLKFGLYSRFTLEYNQEIGRYRGTYEIMDMIEPSHKEVFVLDTHISNVAGSDPAQQAGATQTYIKRYLQMNAFNIADNEDDPDTYIGAKNNKNQYTKSKTQPKNKGSKKETNKAGKSTKTNETKTKEKKRQPKNKTTQKETKENTSMGTEKTLTPAQAKLIKKFIEQDKIIGVTEEDVDEENISKSHASEMISAVRDNGKYNANQGDSDATETSQEEVESADELIED